VSTPLYQVKAEFFKALAHPIRIRVLELLSEREHTVGEMLPQVGIEASHLSQHLSVLRKMNLVLARREGSTVVYSLVSPHVAELLAAARRILTEVLTNQTGLLRDLRAAPGAATTASPAGRRGRKT
jgi:ArsR family transcriptional regulator